MFASIAYAGADAAQAGAESGQSNIINLVTMGVVFFIFWFLMIKPQQKKLKEHQKFISSVQKGDEIITSGGILGKVVGVTDTTLTVEIGDKLRIKILKGSVSGSQESLVKKNG